MATPPVDTVIVACKISAPARIALDEAAAADGRTLASLMRRILVEWLRTNDFLKDGPNAGDLRG